MTARHSGRSRFLRTLLTGAVIALTATAGLLPPSPAAADTPMGEVTWGVRTAESDVGSNRDNFAYTLDPGEHIEDALIVTNHASELLALSVYPADGFTTSSGQLDLVTADTPSVAVGAWSALGDDHLEIPPGESVEVPFTVTIPANTVPGDYTGGILTALTEPSGQAESIVVDRRLGIRMHVRVSGDLEPGLTVEDLAVDYAGSMNPFATGDASVTYTVRNTGNTRLSAGQDVTVSGPWGILPITLGDVGPVPELLPDETWTVSAPATGVLPTFWLTTTSLITPSVPAMAEAAPELEPVRTTTGTWAVPWSPLGLLVILIGGIVTAVLISRRRTIQRTLAEEARVHRAVEQALRDQGSGAH